MKSIILIGPLGVGKSTVGALLAERLGRPAVSMDDLRLGYYAEIGYDRELAARARAADGFWGMYRYWKPFEAHAVERILADHPDCVIDFGAGHSVYEDAGLFGRVRRALAPCPRVVLLLPAPDPADALRILAGREEGAEAMAEINRHFLEHPSNARLATHTVYTYERPPAEVCAAVLAALGLG
ncbi:MAG TPA: hypothetical protein VD886_07755 [Herpetosiphonaceae bacterium]|nr:hypothetical protein [Herpetosiphonaceae bacterium]